MYLFMITTVNYPFFFLHFARLQRAAEYCANESVALARRIFIHVTMLAIVGVRLARETS